MNKNIDDRSKGMTLIAKQGENLFFYAGSLEDGAPMTTQIKNEMAYDDQNLQKETLDGHTVIIGERYFLRKFDREPEIEEYSAFVLDQEGRIIWFRRQDLDSSKYYEGIYKGQPRNVSFDSTPIILTKDKKLINFLNNIGAHHDVVLHYSECPQSPWDKCMLRFAERSTDSLLKEESDEKSMIKMSAIRNKELYPKSMTAISGDIIRDIRDGKRSAFVRAVLFNDTVAPYYKNGAVCGKTIVREEGAPFDGQSLDSIFAQALKKSVTPNAKENLLKSGVFEGFIKVAQGKMPGFETLRGVLNVSGDPKTSKKELLKAVESLNRFNKKCNL